MLAFGMFLGTFNESAMTVMIGVAALLGCIGGGMLYASKRLGSQQS